MTKQITLKGSYSGKEDKIEIGVDEAGRGALCGPVTVAACIMPFGFKHPLVKDSKLLSEGQRVEAREIVMQNAITYSVVHISPDEIDNTNILRATLRGMVESLSEVYPKVQFDLILIDGNQFHGFRTKDDMSIPFETIVGGDNKYSSIAAASILAKTSRDALMKQLDSEVPGYLWNSNKGYGTASHIAAIKEIGGSKHHRQTFISHFLTSTEELF
jgi:ribonuclease HII